MKVYHGVLIVFAAVLFASGCKKDDLGLSETPAIEFRSIAPESVTEFEEEVTIRLFYRDGDGDLGENDPAVKNLFVTDKRNNVVYQYRIQQLAPDGSSIAIQGELEVHINSVSILNASASSETVEFEVYLVDRAGNQSNTITTLAITVMK